MTTGTRLRDWLQFSNANTRLQQFGQTDDESTFGGSTGCTQTILQRLIKAKTGRNYSHDEISRIAGYPWPQSNPGMRGMFSGGPNSEVGRVFRHFDLPYQVVFGWSFERVQKAGALGPVMLGIRYGYWPEWEGYRYGNITADGKPGGFAIRHGKTQLAGAENIFHAVLWLGTRQVKGVSRSYVNEPNKGSPARPEKPDWDTVRTVYVRRAYEQYGAPIGQTRRSLLAWVPTESFKPKGFTG